MDWLQIVSNYGFPIVVSLYLLTKVTTKLDEISSQLIRLNESLPKTTEKKRSGQS